MARTAKTAKTRKATTAKKAAPRVCTTNPRFTVNANGRIVSAAASKAAKANYKSNTALKEWQKAVREASKETGVAWKPSNLKKGATLYTAARKKYNA